MTRFAQLIFGVAIMLCAYQLTEDSQGLLYIVLSLILVYLLPFVDMLFGCCTDKLKIWLLAGRQQKGSVDCKH